MNEYAANRLGTTAASAEGEPVTDLLCAPDEILPAFLQRMQRHGHACTKGYVYTVADHSRQAAMVCHAQRLQGVQTSGNLLLVLTDVESVTLSGEPAPHWQSNLSDLNGMDALSNVALGLVHEVNQPLTAVATYAHSCRRWLSAGSAAHPKLLPTIDKIIEQVHVTGQMINSLKGLVRGHDDERRVCDLNELMRESLELLALNPRIEGCSVETHLETEPCQVLVNAVQIKIVLLNLLRNGLEAGLAFNADDSCLRVTVRAEEEDWASATIHDSGPGITAEAGEQLFQPFETSKPNGLGLGLIISRCLAAANAGQINYLSGVPHGASFKLRLPLAEVTQR